MAEFTECEVIYEDEQLLIVNKPAGVLSHPNSGGTGKQKAAFLGKYDFEQRCFISEAGKLWLIHRLDQDTSGVLLAAKDEASAQKCRALFEAKKIRKQYYALVLGYPIPPKGIWKDHLISRHTGNQKKTSVLPGKAPNAFLGYAVRKNYPAARMCLLKVDLETGKTHQIRAQAAYHGVPVAGDDVYGNFALNKKLAKTPGINRMFLHAAELSFRHPVSGKQLTTAALLPENMERVLSRLR